MRVPIFSREPNCLYYLLAHFIFSIICTYRHTHTYTYILTYYKCTLSHYSKRWRLSRPGKPTHQHLHKIRTVFTNARSSSLLSLLRCLRRIRKRTVNAFGCFFNAQFYQIVVCIYIQVYNIYICAYYYTLIQKQ